MTNLRVKSVFAAPGSLFRACSPNALAFVLVMAVSAPNAFAAESYVDQVARMEAQIFLLQKKQSLDRVRAEIAGAALVVEAPLPSVVSIYGDVRNGMSAKVRFENGLIMEVREGDSLGTASVSKITPTKVIVGKNVALVLAGPQEQSTGTSPGPAGAGEGGPGRMAPQSVQMMAPPSVNLPPLLPSAVLPPPKPSAR